MVINHRNIFATLRRECLFGLPEKHFFIICLVTVFFPDHPARILAGFCGFCEKNTGSGFFFPTTPDKMEKIFRAGQAIP